MFVVFKKGPLRSDERAWYFMEKEDTDCTRALIIYVVKNWVHQLDILNSWHQTTDLAVITLPPKPEVTKRSGCRHSLLPQCLVSQIYADAHSSGQGCNYIYQTPAFFFFSFIHFVNSDKSLGNSVGKNTSSASHLAGFFLPFTDQFHKTNYFSSTV